MANIDREKVIEILSRHKIMTFGDKLYDGIQFDLGDVVALLKEHKSEYENGFNDAMLGKQELMYEGTDGKWHKKDW